VTWEAGASKGTRLLNKAKRVLQETRKNDLAAAAGRGKEGLTLSKEYNIKGGGEVVNRPETSLTEIRGKKSREKV